MARGGSREEASPHVPTLFASCARTVGKNMSRLEQEVWDLPTTVLQQLLPFLTIYDLERIEGAAVKKGVSTQTLWLQLWKKVIGTNPKVRKKPFNWRQKFLQTFFHCILWGTLDISDDKRLNNSRSSALVLGCQHVNKLVIRNKLQGVKEIINNPNICGPLTSTVQKLVFQHLRSVDQTLQHSLLTLLHRLIHYGVVREVILSHWNEPHPELLTLILRMSAGNLCEKEECLRAGSCEKYRLKVNTEEMDPTIQRNILDSQYQQACYTSSDCTFIDTESQCDTDKCMSPSTKESSENLSPLNSQSVTSENISLEGNGRVMGKSDCYKAHNYAFGCLLPSSKRLTDMHDEVSEESRNASQTETNEKADDLYDYIFMMDGSESDTEKNLSCTDENQTKNISNCLNNNDLFGSESLLNHTFELHLRNVSVLEITSIPLSYTSSLVLCKLLRSWVSLQKLVLEYNGLGRAIFLVLKELCALSRCRDSSLSTLVLADHVLHLPVVKLVKFILSTFPALHKLHIDFLLEVENEPLEDEMLMTRAEMTVCCLEDFSLNCTSKTLQVDHLLPVLRKLKSLKHLCLRRASFKSPEDLSKLLLTITDHLSTLESLTIQDVNLTVCLTDVLDLMRTAPLKGLTLDNCRLFERHPAETLPKIISVLKQNQSLTSLSLPANRLGWYINASGSV
uniref:Leucine-rich repeat-containing protein 41 n=1 Tax=Callorhinchus milii TaxID=7868 RepID=A0A4W3GR26_CALMI